MAPPSLPTSRSSSARRPPAQPTTAYSQHTMDPSLCYAPRIYPKPLPAVSSYNGHISYPTATAPSPASRDGQGTRGNALGLSGLPPPPAQARIVPPSPTNMAPPSMQNAAAAPTPTGAVQGTYPFTAPPVHVPVQFANPQPIAQRAPKRRQSSSPPPTPTATPPPPTPDYPNAPRKQSSQPRYEAAQRGSSPTT